MKDQNCKITLNRMLIKSVSKAITHIMIRLVKIISLVHHTTILAEILVLIVILVLKILIVITVIHIPHIIISYHDCFSLLNSHRF